MNGHKIVDLVNATTIQTIVVIIKNYLLEIETFQVSKISQEFVENNEKEKDSKMGKDFPSQWGVLNWDGFQSSGKKQLKLFQTY